MDRIVITYATVSSLSDVDPGTLTYETDWDAIDARLDAETKS